MYLTLTLDGLSNPNPKCIFNSFKLVMRYWSRFGVNGALEKPIYELYEL
jgi:hypothetical protein